MKVVFIRKSKVKMVKYTRGQIHSWRECPDCGGTGYSWPDGGQCERCGGTGEID